MHLSVRVNTDINVDINEQIRLKYHENIHYTNMRNNYNTNTIKLISGY